MTEWTIDAPRRLTLDEAVEQLDIDLISGQLNVMATDGPARVEIRRVGRDPVDVTCQDGRLLVRQRRPRWSSLLWWFGRRFRADVSVAVPPDVRARLRLVSGPLVASGLRGETQVEVTSGQVTLAGVGGRTRAKLVSGPVEALGMTGEVTLETVSGELVLADSSVGRVRATTVSGSITCDLDGARDGDIQLDATSGNITVRVREDSDLSVRLQTSSGRITSGFAEVGDAGSGWSKESYGIIGTGAGRLWARSTSGNLALLARPADPDTDPEDEEQP